MGLQWGSQRKPTRERSLRPEPPGGTVEATKPFQHSGKRPRQGVRERAGHNMSEHRASFEKGNADADPVEIGGRLVFSGKKTWFRVRKDMMSDKRTGEVRRSRGDGMRAEEAQRNTGSPPRWGHLDIEADALWKAARVDGIYSEDPEKNPRNDRRAKE